MGYLFNNYGWFSGEGTGNRSTDLEPVNLSLTETPGELRSNWTGYLWANIPYVVPVVDDPSVEIRSQVWEKIKEHRDQIKFGGVQVEGKWFHTDTFSRTQWLGMMMLGQNVPGIQWKTMDGTFVTITPTLVQDVFQAILVADTAIFQVAETHRLAMEASNDPVNYNFSTGWPVTYEG